MAWKRKKFYYDVRLSRLWDLIGWSAKSVRPWPR
jgi:hypothetical protein